MHRFRSQAGQRSMARIISDGIMAPAEPRILSPRTERNSADDGVLQLEIARFPALHGAGPHSQTRKSALCRAVPCDTVFSRSAAVCAKHLCIIARACLRCQLFIDGPACRSATLSSNPFAGTSAGRRYPSNHQRQCAAPPHVRLRKRTALASGLLLHSLVAFERLRTGRPRAVAQVW